MLSMGIPEPLKYQLTGYWSRRINKKDRIIYKVFEDKVIVLIVSAIGHMVTNEKNLKKPPLTQTPSALRRSS